LNSRILEGSGIPEPVILIVWEAAPMAHNENKIFEVIRQYLVETPNALKTTLGQRLFDEKVIGSIGTAHKYVLAYFAQDALRTMTRIPEVSPSDLPAGVHVAYTNVLAANNALKNEIALALEQLSQQSTATFGKMVAVHDVAQREEIAELADELENLRQQLDAQVALLAQANEREEALRQTLIAREATLLEAAAALDELRVALNAQESKVATLVETATAKDKTITSLESERVVWSSRAEDSDQQVRELREQARVLNLELERLRRVEGAMAQMTADLNAKAEALAAAEAKSERFEARLLEITTRRDASHSRSER
jgi:hypothetical protein